MPSISSHADKPADARMRDTDREARKKRIDRLDRLATTLDSKFRIPVLGIPVGWDSILGLIPGVGDLVTALPGAAMFYEARRMGARKRASFRIAANTGIDMAFGAIPLVGDAFDLVFKSHRRNMAILKDELARIETNETKEDSWHSDTVQTTTAETARKS